MKLITMMLLSLFLGKGCDKEQKQDMETAVIEYEANTRGFYQKITVQNHKVSVSKDRKGQDVPVATDISEADWKELVQLFQEINLEELPNLKAPTEKRFYDGAAIANLKVTYKDKVYETNGFDHGFPPAEIERMVNKINSLLKTE